MNLSVTATGRYSPPVEFVERKGTGHPDTVCDAMAEMLCRELAAGYIEHTGTVQAFNVDKAILAAGSVRVDFGGGEHLTKARMIVVGKADFRQWNPDLDALRDIVKSNLAATLPDADLDEAYEVDVWLSPSSSDLALVVSGREHEQVPLSNDTSFAVASLPRSPLEESVYQIEKRLNSAEFRSEVPVGRDIKVMGARSDEIQITIAAPVLARKVANRSEYDAALVAVRDEAQAVADSILDGGRATIAVNQADKDESPYLTLTGSSAEAGDDGQVGRGNRFGGLITPYRPMSLEAAAGKNPAAHVGKTFHAIGHDIASAVLAETDAEEATVKMLSRIGRPVTDPLVVHVLVAGSVDEGAVERIVKEKLSDWQGVRDRLIRGDYELY